MREIYRLFTSSGLSILHRIMHTSTLYPWLRGALLCCVVIAFSSFGRQTQGPSASLPGSVAVTFASSISYEQALRLVTNLVLQPAMDCVIGTEMLTPGSNAEPLPVWQPVGQKDTFMHTHRLLVDPTEFAPDDWWRSSMPLIRGV